jgi:uncharacterized protein DUF1801
MSDSPLVPADVAAVFAAYPASAQAILRDVRDLVFSTAAQNPTVGTLTETLKWGEPSYLTAKSKSGATVRLCWKASDPEFGGLYFNCQTNLVESMQRIYPNVFIYQGKRAVLFSLINPFETDALQHCIEMALTYHVNKRRVH